jgi:ADP-ribose pyrophosphatase YjhB (NUDIX family)
MRDTFKIMENFQVTAVEDGKKYWISRSMATRSELIVHDDNKIYILINKRGEGTPDFQHCWNIPCGYLEYDVTCAENATKELLEETGVFVPDIMWEFLGIEDDPQRGNKQNVTAVYQLHVHMSVYEKYKAIGETMNSNGGEINEVEDVELMELTEENIENHQWAFDHKERVKSLLKQLKYE